MTLAAKDLPATLDSEEELDEFLTRPTPAVTAFIRALTGRLLILGAGGKMGPTLAVLARRSAEAANHPIEIAAVSRFSDEAPRRWLEEHGVRTLQADLLDRPQVESLPDAAHVIN